jgi:ABC-type multidrug transport system ATPase subunit
VTTVIAVEGVRKHFRKGSGWRDAFGKGQEKLALDGVDLHAARGEVVGLLGPNGAGKTTLIRVLCGLVIPDAGTAWVNGHDVLSNSREARRTMGLVYGDERNFYWRLSLLENLQFYAAIYGVEGRVARRRIDEFLELFDLVEARNSRMYTLSSGMKQRAAIARGLIMDPELVIMDEPSRSLDPVGAAELHKLVVERVADGRRTVLLATNVMREAELLCDRLVLIDHGRNVMTGTLQDFRRRLHGEVSYEVVVRGAADGWRAGLGLLPGVNELEFIAGEDSLDHIRMRVDPDGQGLTRALAHLVEHQAEIRSCTMRELSLDEIFQILVRGGGAQALAVAEAV